MCSVTTTTPRTGLVRFCCLCFAELFFVVQVSAITSTSSISHGRSFCTCSLAHFGFLLCTVAIWRHLLGTCSATKANPVMSLTWAQARRLRCRARPRHKFVVCCLQRQRL